MKYNASKDILMEKYPSLSRKSLGLFIVKNKSSTVKAETDEQSAFKENIVAVNTAAAVTYLSLASYFKGCVFSKISSCYYRENILFLRVTKSTCI